ncbi:DnaJ-class molecular chaperone CbpA [hydrothermal vent metagenome]|uniref:DnaJ-class molecular chaperone CbpA n=1 Tax=hydrothermal vent metagenome TaxID=652676 RepID=A0A3B0V8K4_9ZZZZ
MEYKDYYKILGVDKKASKVEIKKAYKRLAGKYHPDVSKVANAEEKFKEVNEAYEVLKSDENRAAYDQLGSNWKAAGQGFGSQGGGFSGGADFSDFFESVFGSAGGRQAEGFGGQQHFQRKGQNIKQTIKVPLEDLYTGVNRTFVIRQPEQHPSGQTYMVEKRLNVKIPKGIEPGKSIRLKGKGESGLNGGPSGDLLLKIELDSHSKYELKGRDVYLDLLLTPWEAALGAKVNVPTPAGAVGLNIPKNMQTGKKMRLKGKGLPASVPGNLYAVIKIVIPPDNDKAKQQWQDLSKQFDFNPRTNTL